MISGGTNVYTGRDKALRSAEIYLPDTKTSCSLPNMPEMRRYHTQDGGLVCGGELEFGSHQNSNSHILTICDTWSNGTWLRSHTLKFKRRSHVSWTTPSGVYLIGGFRSPWTSELVMKNGTVREAFRLTHKTM